MSEIRTSWIIRTKNEEKWIGAVLDKLNDQTVKDFNVVIVDSGSTDRTLEIAREFDFCRIISINPEQFNYSYALNYGISHTNSEFIGMLSGHSLPPNNHWYESVLKNFSDENVVGVSGLYYSLPDGSFLEKLGDWLNYLFNFSRKKRLNYCPIFSNTNSIIRRSAWEKYNFDESLFEGCEDYDWASEMIYRGYNIVRDPGFYVYHSHGGLGRAQWHQRFFQWQKVIREIIKRKRPRESRSKVFTPETTK